MIMAADTYAMQLHAARVYLRESALRRGQPSGFHFTLLEWAGNARRRAMALRAVRRRQFDLFNPVPVASAFRNPEKQTQPTD